MKELACKICNKQYKTIQSLCNHNKRFHNSIKTTFSELKQPLCDFIQPLVDLIQPLHICCKCNKNFKHYNNKWRHEKICKKIKLTNEIVNENISTHTINNIIINNINNNNINNNTINNNNINNNTINNYSNDNLEYISDAFIKKMFNHLRYNDDHIKSIPSMIENIKFNPNHKENNNVKITNKVAMVYDNNKWSTVGKKELFDELYLFATNLFKNWSEMKDFITEEMKTNYTSFSKTTQISLTKDFMEEINRKAYIYTKNNDMTLDK